MDTDLISDLKEYLSGILGNEDRERFLILSRICRWGFHLDNWKKDLLH